MWRNTGRKVRQPCLLLTNASEGNDMVEDVLTIGTVEEALTEIEVAEVAEEDSGTIAMDQEDSGITTGPTTVVVAISLVEEEGSEVPMLVGATGMIAMGTIDAMETGTPRVVDTGATSEVAMATTRAAGATKDRCKATGTKAGATETRAGATRAAMAVAISGAATVVAARASGATKAGATKTTGKAAAVATLQAAALVAMATREVGATMAITDELQATPSPWQPRALSWSFPSPVSC